MQLNYILGATKFYPTFSQIILSMYNWVGWLGMNKVCMIFMDTLHATNLIQWLVVNLHIWLIKVLKWRINNKDK